MQQRRCRLPFPAGRIGLTGTPGITTGPESDNHVRITKTCNHLYNCEGENYVKSLESSTRIKVEIVSFPCIF